jgi:hypothetical protein
VRRLHPQVARRAGDEQRGQRRQLLDDPGQEPLGLSGHAEPALAAGVQVATVPPYRQVQVAPVADAAGDHRRRERHPQPVPLRDRADRLPHLHAAVGGGDRVQRADRDLVLAGGVLGVELVDLHALGGQRPQQLGAEVRLLDQPGHPVRGAEAGRLEPRATGPPQRELDLDAGPERHALAGGGRDQMAQHAAGARGVHRAVLGDPVHRRPGPAGLGGEGDQPVQVRVQPQVAVRTAQHVGGDDRVVGEEGVEDRRHPHAPGHGPLQAGHRHALDPVDPRRVHPGQHHTGDAVRGHLRRPLGGPVVVARAAAGDRVGESRHAGSLVGASPWSTVSRSPARRAIAGLASTTAIATSSQTAQIAGFQPASPVGYGTTLR